MLVMFYVQYTITSNILQNTLFIPLQEIQCQLAHKKHIKEVNNKQPIIVQELCESRGGRPGLSVLMSLLVSVDVKIY